MESSRKYIVPGLIIMCCSAVLVLILSINYYNKVDLDATIIEKDLMSKRSLILIDDTPQGNGFNSKGLFSIPYLTSNGYGKVIHEYQALLSNFNPFST